MALIHQIEESDQLRHVLDPVRGHVISREKVIKQGSAASISHEGEEYHILPDGSFDVSDEAAEFLCKHPGWYAGANPYAEPLKTAAA